MDWVYEKREDALWKSKNTFADTVFTLSPLQMTPCQPAVTWTWRTGSPTWSRSCSFRKMRSSCWNQLWLMPCVDWATARSRPRGCTQEVLAGGLWLLRLQPSRPKVTEMPAVMPCMPLMSHRYFCRAEGEISNNHLNAAPYYWSVNRSDNDYLTFSATALASASLQTCE